MFRRDTNAVGPRVASLPVDPPQPPLSLQFARVIIVIPPGPEFEWEKHALLNEVIPDVQQYAAQVGVDVEFLEYCPNPEDAIENADVQELLEQNASYIMAFLGDKYGECALPLNMRTAELDAIRTAAFEASNDVRLLDKYYVLDKSRNPAEYRLRDIKIDEKQRRAIVDVIQLGAKQAYEEGVINQISPKRQQRFFSSPIELIALFALQFPQKATFVLRKIEGVEYTSANASWLDEDEEGRKKMETLKNTVSASSACTLSFNVHPETADIELWLQSRSHDKYIESFVQQASERLRSLVASLALTSVVPRRPSEIAKDENAVHMEFAESQLPQKWIARQRVDERIALWTAESTKGAYIHISGHDATGKTALICKLHSLLLRKRCYVITRFVSLTPSSNFANEIWNGICRNMCALSGQSDAYLQNSFHLASTLSIFKSLLQKLDRPLFVLLDDSNLIKYGRVLSALDKPFRKLLPNLTLIATSCSPSQIPFMPSPQTFQMPEFTNNEIIDYLKDYVDSLDRKLTADQYGLIKQQLTGKEKNIVFGRVLVDEMLKKGNRQTESGIEGRFSRLEADLGISPVRAFARLISVSPHGLTSLELLDALSADKQLIALFSDCVVFPPFLLYSIINNFGCLLLDFVAGNRIIYKWSHHFIASAARHRYLTNTMELKTAHSLLADVFADVLLEADGVSPRSAALAPLVFPRPLKREDGSANIRKVNNLWYHLLHTGNMDALKELALCHFDYIDTCVRSCGLAQLLSLYEECSMQVLHHDIQVLCEQVLLPSLITVVRDGDQLAAEIIGRLRYTRAENSHFLNTMVEQAMSWVDMYSKQPLLVPLTCWISPPKMKQVLSFGLSDWKSSRTILQPTHNHQHLLVSGNESSPGLIYMYHIASQLLIRTFTGHTDRVTSLSIAMNGQFFISTSLDQSVRIWGFSQNDAINVMKPHNGKVICSLVSSDCQFIVTGGTDSCANVISMETGEILRSFKEHTGTVVSIALTSNDEFLVTGSGDFVVMVWDLSTGELAVRMSGLMAPVSCLAMTSNDAFVTVACEDETLRVFSLVSGQELHELSGHDGKILAVVSAHDDCQLFAATVSKIYAYDLHNGKLLDILDCVNQQPVASLKITSDNYFLLSACGDQVDVWNIHHRVHETENAAAPDQQGVVTGICMARDEKSAACATRSGVVAVWDLDICQCIWTIVQRKGIAVVRVRFSNDCTYLLSGDAEGQINVWETSNGKLLRSVNHHSSSIESIHCFSDGIRILSADSSNILFVWNLHCAEDTLEVERILTFSGIQPPVFLSPNNVHLVGYFPESNNEMRIWMLGEESIIPKTKIHHSEEITCYCTTNSGTLLVTGSADQSLKIWQIESGFLTQVLVGHEAEVTCCAVAEDERLVVSGGGDRQIIIWNVSTGDALLSLKTNSPITAVSITTDATVALSADETGWIEAYDTEHGILLSSFNAHGAIESLISSVDGNRILALLANCAQLPILCLHNTPACATISRPAEQRRRSARAHSISSLNSNISEPKLSISGGPAQVNNLTASGANGSKTIPRTFDRLERSKSRASVIEKERPTNTGVLAPVSTATTKSSLCSIV